MRLEGLKSWLSDHHVVIAIPGEIPCDGGRSDFLIVQEHHCTGRFRLDAERATNAAGCDQNQRKDEPATQ